MARSRVGVFVFQHIAALTLELSDIVLALGKSVLNLAFAECYESSKRLRNPSVSAWHEDL